MATRFKRRNSRCPPWPKCSSQFDKRAPENVSVKHGSWHRSSTIHCQHLRESDEFKQCSIQERTFTLTLTAPVLHTQCFCGLSGGLWKKLRLILCFLLESKCMFFYKHFCGLKSHLTHSYGTWSSFDDLSKNSYLAGLYAR